MKLEMGKSWTKKLQGRIEGFNFEVGVLEDKPHLDPVVTPLYQEPQLKTYAGGPVRPTSRVRGEMTIGDVLIANMERMNINLLAAPFKDRSADILKFTDAFLKMALAPRNKISPKRVENLLQAIVRNPILRQEYGTNSASTADLKGFNRLLFDTAQTFKALKAKVKRV